MTVIRADDWSDREHVHPGALNESSTVAKDASSPVAIERAMFGGTIAYWARSPGYAWGFIKLHEASGGERTLRLSFSALPLTQIDEGIKRLAEIIRDVQRQTEPVGLVAARAVPLI